MLLCRQLVHGEPVRIFALYDGPVRRVAGVCAAAVFVARAMAVFRTAHWPASLAGGRAGGTAERRLNACNWHCGCSRSGNSSIVAVPAVAHPGAAPNPWLAGGNCRHLDHGQPVLASTTASWP